MVMMRLERHKQSSYCAKVCNRLGKYHVTEKKKEHRINSIVVLSQTSAVNHKT